MKPVEDVRNDKRYEAKTRSALQADAYDRTLHQRRQNRRVEDEAEMVTLWEFYDLRKGTVCVFAESGDG
ncbi:MAG: hypothetical protein ACO3C6_10770, partial [Steroidobacteraceae bacterium]